MAERRLSLQSLIPDAEQLLTLDASDLAFNLLTCLLTLPEGELNLYNLNLAGEFSRAYPSSFKQQIESCVSGGWSWLLGQGYLGQRPGSHDSAWVTITPQGRRWVETEKLRRSSKTVASSSAATPTLSFSTLGLEDYRGVPPSQELLIFLVRLIAIEPGDRDFDFTFSSILTLFLYSSDSLAIWFQNYIKEATISVEAIISASKIEPQTLAQLRATGRWNALVRSKPPTWSSSSQRLIQEASQIAQRTAIRRDLILEPRHLMAAFIYSRIGHEDQLEGWGFNAEDWGTSFYRWTATNYPDEATGWLNLHQEVFRRSPRLDVVEPNVPPPHSSTASVTEPILDSSEKQPPSPQLNVGPSTHVARDKWTIDDALGYFPFAYAIFRFLTDRDTAPPLAISIQAPWGGGKTSLMRMVQAQLDPENPVFEKVDTEALLDRAVSATVKHISDLIESGQREPEKDKIDVGTAKNRVTVWFNAWKYESTDQIWAGLVDAIVNQVTERLPLVERELFFFRLHWKRLDVAKIRKKITEGILSKLLEILQRWWWAYLAIPVASYLISHFASFAASFTAFKDLAPIGIALDLVLLCSQWLIAHKKEFETPAKVEFGDLVSVPDYDTKLGFIHQVSEDLKHTLELVNPASRPLVIFIDDLDRCSPGKVSAVIEAVNLFLAGEFEHCMFLLGIDDEVVAAALNKAHADVFAQMPAYARATSIGWRFMDKFVQLPFIMPPPTAPEMADYARSLLITKNQNGKLSLTARQKVAESVEENRDGKSVGAIVEDVNRELGLDSAQKQALARDAETIKKMDTDIREFSDDEQGIAEVILKAVDKFSRNPRDVKRFVNSFRFYYFLRSALLARQAEGPSVDQLSRWILLSLRWPGIVRWLRSTESDANHSLGNGLSRLEQLTADSDGHLAWGKNVAALMGLEDKEGAWLLDEHLYDYFHEEHGMPEPERISSSLGKGLW